MLFQQYFDEGIQGMTIMLKNLNWHLEDNKIM